MINTAKKIFYNTRIIAITTILFAFTLASAFSVYSYLPEVHADNTLRQVLEINGTFPAGTSIFNVTISPPLANLDKSIAFLTFEYNQQNQHRDTFRSWNFTDTSTLTIYGNDQTPSANFAVGFHGTIYELTSDSDGFIQHLEFIMDELLPEGEFENSIPTSVNASTSFLVPAGQHSDSDDSSVGVEEFTKFRIINSTFYGLEVGDTPNTGPTIYHVSVVDLNRTGVLVQRGQGTLDSGETVDTVTPSAYNKTNSLLFVSYNTNGDFSQDPDDVAVKATINGADDIIIERADASSQTVDYSWELIEYEDGFLVAQHFNGTQVDAESVSFEPIPIAVGNVSRSWAIGTMSSPFGLGNGLSDSTAIGAFDRSTGTITLENATHVELVRGTGTDSFEVGLQVVEFLITSADNTEIIPSATNNVNVTDSVTVGLATTETIDETLNNVTVTDSVLLDVIKGLPAGTAPAIFFNSSIPNVLNFTDFFTEVSDSGMIGEDITLDNQRPTKVIIANVSGTSTNGTLTMKVFTNVTLDVSTLGDGVLRATSDSYDLSTFDISSNRTLTFNFTSAPFITGSAFGLEMAGMNGSVNLPIDQSNAGGKCFEVKDLVPIANFSKGPKDTLCEQFSFEVYVSNATSDDVIVTDSVVTTVMATQIVNDTSTVTDDKILNTTKVILTTGAGGGGGGTISNSGTPSEDSIPYIQTWDGDYDITTALSGVSNSSAYIGVRSPGNFDSLNITSISVLPGNPGSAIPDSAGHFMTGVILSNVTASNNFEDIVIEGVSTNSRDLGLLNDPPNSYTTFFFDPPITITNDTGEIFLGFNYSTNGVTAPSLATTGIYSTAQSGTCTFVEHGIGNSWSTDCSGISITNIQMEVMDQLDSPLPNFTISGGDLVTDKLLVYHTFDTAQEVSIDGSNFKASGNAGTYGNRATAVTSMDGGIIQSGVTTSNPKLGDGSIDVDNTSDVEVLLSSLENYGTSSPDQDWKFMTDTKVEDWGMSFWLRCDDCGTIGDDGSIFNMMADGEDFGIRIVLTGTDTIEVDLANDGGLFVSGLSSGVSLGVDSWTHVGLTFEKDELDVGDADNGTVILYINGTQVANATSIDFADGNGQRNNVVAIGERVSSQTKWVTRTAEDFSFGMDDLCIWGPEFGGAGYLPTAANMTFIYNGGTGNTCIAGATGGAGDTQIVTATDTVNAFISSSALNQTNNDNANVTDAHILNTTKVLNDTDTGGSPTSMVLFDTTTEPTTTQIDFATYTKIGQLLTLTDTQIESITIKNVTTVDSLGGNLTAVIYTGVLNNTFVNQTTLVATADIINLANAPYASNPGGFSVQFNFTGAPSLTGSDIFVGIHLVDEVSDVIFVDVTENEIGGNEGVAFAEDTSPPIEKWHNLNGTGQLFGINEESTATADILMKITKLVSGGGGGTILGVGTVSSSGSSLTEYQLQIGGHPQIPDTGGGINVITVLGDDDVITGNLINLTSAKITRFTVGDHGPSTLAGGTTNATMQAFIWSNATVGSSKLSDLVVEASSEILELNNYIEPQVPDFREGFDQRNDFYPISFNFTGAPTLTGEYLTGFLYKDIGENLTFMSVAHNRLDIGPNFLPEDLIGVCIGNGTAFTDTLSSTCPSTSGLITAFFFSIAAERTVADLTVDTPIAPTKLKAYWTFDDNAVDGELALNAGGSLGHEADASMLRMLTMQSATLNRNSTGGLIGASYNHTMCGGAGGSCISNGTIQHDADFLQAGLFSDDHRKNWQFLHELGSTANKTSVSMWVKFPTDAESIPSDGIPFLSTGSTQGTEVEDDGVRYGIGASDTELSVMIKVNSTALVDFQFDPLDSGDPDEFTFPGSTSSGPPFFDGEWHHIVYIVDKGNSTFPVKICLDGTSPVGIQSGCKFMPLDNVVDTSTKDPSYTLMLASIWETTGISQDLSNFEMDEVAIWEDYLLTDSEIDQIASMAVVTGNATGGAGVIVTDTVNAFISSSAFNQTNNDNANVTDAHILNTTKVLFDIDTSGGGGGGGALGISVPYIHTKDGELGDGDTFFLSVDSGIIGHRSPFTLTDDITITSISGIFSGFNVNNGTIQGIILSNVTGTNNFEDRVIEGLSTNTVDLTTLDFLEYTTFNFDPPVVVADGPNIFFGFNYTGDGANGISIGVSDVMDTSQTGVCLGVNQTVGVSWSSFDCSTGGSFSHDSLTIEVMMQLDSPVPEFEVTGGISPSNLVVYLPFDSALDVDYDVGNEIAFGNAGSFGHNATAITFDSGGQTPRATDTPKLGDASAAVDSSSLNSLVIQSIQNVNQFDFLSDDTNDSYGISFWIRSSDFSSLSDSAPILSNMGNEEYGMRIFVASDQLVNIEHANSDGLITAVAGVGSALGDDTWTHIGLTVNKTELSLVDVRLYVNGTNVASDLSTDFSTGQQTPAEAPTLQIGEEIASNSVWQSQTAESINFQMDDLCIWKDYLPSPTDMSTIYNSGSGSTCSTASAVTGANEGGVLTSDSVNAFISSSALNQIINDNVNVTDIQPIFNVTKVIDNNANITDTVVISADFNQTVGTADNNVNVTDSVTIINSKIATIPSGTNTAIITDSVLLNFTKFLIGDQVDMSIANLTIVNATAPPSGDDVPTGGPPTDAPETGAGSGGGGVPTVRSDPLSASLTGLTLTLSEPEHTLSSEIIVNPFFSSVSELGTIILNWDQQEPIQVTAVTVPPMFEEFVEFDIVQGQSLNFLGKKADPTDTFSTGIIDYEVTLPSLALGVSQETNPFGAAVTFFNFVQLVILNEYTIPVTVDAIHNGKPFQFTSEIVINHVKEVRWVVIAITIAGVAFLAVWGKGFFTDGTAKSGSFKKSLNKAKRATVDKQKRGSFRKELERQRSADRQNIKKLKKK